MSKRETYDVEHDLDKVYLYLSRLVADIWYLQEKLGNLEGKEKKRSGVIED